jgi:hypothetical protein
MHASLATMELFIVSAHILSEVAFIKTWKERLSGTADHMEQLRGRWHSTACIKRVDVVASAKVSREGEERHIYRPFGR